MPGDEERVVAAFRTTLESEGWRTQDGPQGGTDLLAVGPDGGRLVVEAKSATSSPGLDVDTGYGQLLRRMAEEDDETTRYALVVRDEPTSVRAVERVAARVRAELRIDLYAVAEDGGVRQLT